MFSNPFRLVLAVLPLIFSGCQSINPKGDKEEIKAVPENGLLGAKLAALEYAMENLSDQDREFGSEGYLAYGISDSDPLHRKAMLSIFKGRTPPVVDSSQFYSRSSNSQWMKGRPVMKWSATATKDPEHPFRVDVLVGWMHSQIINEFASYKTEYDGVGWTILDIEIIDLGPAP